MTCHELPDRRLRALVESRFQEYIDEASRAGFWTERYAGIQGARDKRQRDFIASIGIDPKKFDAGIEKDSRAEEAELKSFLAEFRPKSANRHPMRAADAHAAALQSELLTASGQMVLPSFASSIFTGDKARLGDIAYDAPWVDGPIDSGWVLPDNPALIRISDHAHDSNPFCYSIRHTAYPEFSSHFTFTPADTGTYQMMAVMACHGFYVLRCDDSWWNCRDTAVSLTMRMNAHQYASIGWQDGPTLLDVETQNAEEVINFDRTFFPHYTAQLRAGDPVIVTVNGTVRAYAHGGGAYAELNFGAGTANYIQPLFLSVQRV